MAPRRSTVKDDPGDLRRYLEEVRAVPLLTSADEDELSTAIREAQAAAARLESEDGIGPAERRRLQEAVRAGDAARSRFVQSNLRLVIWVARRYRNAGLPLGDLIQEGNLGLMRAVETFDSRKGFTFSTYATWWIRQRIGRALADSSRTIRLPGHVAEALTVLGRVSSELLESLGREPTAEELAKASGLGIERVRQCLRAEPDLVSLSAGVGEDGGELGDRLADLGATAPEDAAVQAVEAVALRASLGRLRDREREVIELRYGFVDGSPRTLEEIGRRFSVTRERARQIEAKALTKLRHPCIPKDARSAFHEAAS
jgi:RNA polymerase primary sigma factor